MSVQERQVGPARQRWIDKLRCCACQSENLSVDARSEDELGIVDGEIRCGQCGRVYPISDGIYHFFDPGQTQEVGDGETWKADEFANLMPEGGYYRTHAEWLERRLGFPSRVAQRVSEYESKYNKERMMELLALKGNDSVLDLGCGVGYLTFDYLARHAGQDILGICVDVLPLHVQLVRARQKDERNGRIVPVLGNAEELPLKDGSVGGIISSECMEHVPDPPRCAREMFRVLAPGGQALISTPNRAPYERFHRVRLALRRLLREGPGPKEDFFDNPQDHKALAGYLRDAGFHIERIEFAIKVPMAKRLLILFPEKLALGTIHLLEKILIGRYFGVNTLIQCVKPAHS